LIFLAFQRFYIVTSRQLKRLYSVSKSPLFSHFSETVTGSPVIRAYQQTQRFVQESEAKMQTNVMSYYLSAVSNRWLSLRVENLANVLIFFTAFFGVWNRDILSPGLAALAITYAINVTGDVVWMVRMACDLENNCVALERIFEYTKLQTEGEWKSNNNSEKPLENWPQNGIVEFENYKTKYREGLPNVLKGLNLKVNSREKIGICGRTGAGKSSLTLALFRIIEANEGKIMIDGKNVSQMGLHELRSKLSIIPQDPVLFTGTLRFNIDPIGLYPDEELWRILELSHLKDHIGKHLSKGLDHEVTEGGSNFSVGQRQLICLARALLRRSQILILDEATAAVDPETDELIQKTIRHEFKDCTILTIAHRLNTIMDYDRIVLMKDGQVLEIGPPQELLKDKCSHFRAMAMDAGISINCS